MVVPRLDEPEEALSAISRPSLRWSSAAFLFMYSSAIRAKASTSVTARTVLVEEGRFDPDLGSSAQVNSSSPQKSRSFRTLWLKNPLRPPSVVILSRRPRMMKSISSTGSPSLTM
ncbi:unnamed protein product [Spirodela intermedia]|nr:unnamed protein product [Spirodela intermedia]CAA6668066.1 unnamed protein product [Spirodela intermedia]